MSADDFEELLLWLDPDPDGTGIPDQERGAEKYEKIRGRLIRIYRNRGSRWAEEIADEAFARVAPRAKEFRLTYEGDPALYIYGVAKRVDKEFRRQDRRPVPTTTTPRPDADEVERRHMCLERCLRTLKPEKRELVLSFYEGEKREKIENRKRLAEELGISSRALSLRVMQIRRALLKCLKDCLGD